MAEQTVVVDGVEYTLIYVVPVEHGRVGLAERHPAHPGGEAWVAWDALSDEPPEPVLVAQTAFVNLKLGRQAIKQVQTPASAKGRQAPSPKKADEED